MAQPSSQTSQVVWNITNGFCPRLIVTNGVIRRVSTINRGHFTGSTLWISWSIELIASELLSQNPELKSVVFENGSRLKQIDKAIFSNTSLKFIQIPSSVTTLSVECFSECELLSLVIFETGSRLSQIESDAFRESGLIEIVLPSSVEILGGGCFSWWRSLFSVTFESGSKLSRIEMMAFRETGLVSIVIPSSVEFLGDGCFCDVTHFPRLHLNLGQDYQEFKNQYLKKFQ
jgi:hypothetical protein